MAAGRPDLLFFLAVMVSSLYGGWGPGLFAVALSSLAFDYFLPPLFRFDLDTASFLRLGPFLVANLLVVGVIEVKRRAEEARLKIAAQVQRSEAYLAEAQKLSRSGSWACKAEGLDATYWSEEMFRIVGLPPAADPPSVEEFAAFFPHEAWARLKENFEAARLRKTAFDGDFPLISKDGTNRTLRMVGHPVLGASGEILEFVGTAIDVTEQREARAALQRAFDEIKGIRRSPPADHRHHSRAGMVQSPRRFQRFYESALAGLHRHPRGRGVGLGLEDCGAS